MRTLLVLFCRVLSVIGVLTLAAVADAQESATAAVSSPASLDGQFQTAKASFKPIDEAKLAAARAELAASIKELERFVQPQSANGRRWLNYLRWDALTKQLNSKGPADLGPLAETYQQLNKNEAGLELAQFRRVSSALRNYVSLASLAGMEDAATVYQRQLEGLAADLQRRRELRDAPAGSRAPLELDIERRLDFIAGAGQAADLLAAIRQEFAAPNAYIDVSTELLRAAAEEPIDRRDPITDNILGTSIRGDGHTTGSVNVRTVPSEERAVIELSTKGHVESQNTGRNGPAVIRSTGHTDFNATKEIHLSDSEFRSPSAKVSATSRSDIHSIAKAGGGIGSRMVSSEGWSRARQNESRVNEIAADHAEERIRRRIDDEVSKKIRDARARYEDEYRKPLARRGELPEQIHFRSTGDAISIVVTQANRGQLAASGGPPEMPSGQDLVLRLNDSAINNYAAVLLAGATASETEPNQDGAKFDVVLPKWMKEAWQKKRTDAGSSEPSSEPFKPSSLTFRAVRPLTVSFADGKVVMTIHLAQLKSGEEVFEDWNITGTFAPQVEEGDIVLRREGDLVVLPGNFDPRAPRSLNSQEVGIRGNLTKVLNERSAQGRGFPSLIRFEKLKPTGTMEKVGPLAAKEVKSNQGWLTLAWRRESP